MAIVTQGELTNREREEMEFQQQMFDRQAEHTQKVKAMELEVTKIQAKWSSLLRLPIIVVKMPLFIFMGVAYCIAVARRHEPSEAFWNLLK